MECPAEKTCCAAPTDRCGTSPSGSARLQTFPDTYWIHGAWGEAVRQIGNAVPVELARIVDESVSAHLFSTNAI